MTARQLLERAISHHQAGRLDKAEAGYLKIIAQEPDNVDALHLLGLIAHQRGDHQRALAYIGAALERAPEHRVARFNLANILMATGDAAGGIEQYERVVAQNPEAGALVNLANAYLGTERYLEALQTYDRALACAPDSQTIVACKVTALLQIADRFRDEKNFDGALEAAHAALALDDGAKAHVVIGQVLAELGDLCAARTEFEAALRLDGESFDAYLNLGVHAYITGDAGRAIAMSQAAIARQPDHARAHFNLAIAHLLAGNYREGWSEFEWRRRDPKRAAEFPYESFERWQGQPFAGRRLLLSAEQGFGDALFLARYLPAVVARGGEVVVETPPELLAMFGAIPDIVLHDRRQGPFPMSSWDLQLPAFSLPHVFGTDETNVPGEVPYLPVDPARVARWRSRLALDARAKNVGVVWAGASGHRLDRLRSLSLDTLAPLFGLPCVRWFSLQKGERASDLAQSPHRANVEDLGSDIADFADTAAIVSLLDLVITVDTSVAHVAGALGRPVWTLLGLGTDWRWRASGERTPWYPTMRLFRQHEPGVWSGAIADVVAALAV